MLPVIQIGCITGSICSTLTHYEYKSGCIGFIDHALGLGQ